ncbi:MAG: lysophospholipase [Bacteroidales bacterium]|nr:lysophospholipase [Bacteroidales bacterium]
MLKSGLLSKEEGVDFSENYWKSADGLNLFSQSWHPSGNAKAVIHLIHGLGEHSGRYSYWAEKLVGEGFAVRAFDLRGHGRSEGKRGYSSGYYKLLNDIDTFLEIKEEVYSSIPSFLYGHSLGGNLVLNYAIQKNSAVDGLIVSSPWLELINPPSKPKLFAVHVISNLFPGLLAPNGLKPEDLSRDLRIVHSYKQDDLVHDRIGIKLFTEAYEAGIRASLSIYKINVPLLIMHGSEDRITSCKTSRNFVRNSSDKTTFIEWQGGYHELHNDLDREKVFESVVSWINRNI